MKTRIFIFSAICSVFFFSQCGDKKKSAQNMKSVAVKEATVDTAIKTKVDTSEVITEVKDEKIATVSEPKVNINDKYFLIVSSYNIKGNAEKCVERLNEIGYEPKIVMRGEDGYFRVALRSFTNFKEALKDAKSLRADNKEFQEIWVLVRGSKKIQGNI